MTDDSLSTFVRETHARFGTDPVATAAAVRSQLERLARAPVDEPWLAALHREAPASRELVRDAVHGFVLLAHTEPAGLYRAPHDHGRNWVVYALQRGAMEVRTWALGEAGDPAGLVLRDVSVMRPGEARIYREGEIHDTRALAEGALLLRFTSRDLKLPEEAARITRYAARDVVGAAGAA
ncbi:MAG: hypothetical protein U0325_17855 [Polyangiales bacterium]